jgi:hypothetical protein
MLDGPRLVAAGRGRSSRDVAGGVVTIVDAAPARPPALSVGAKVGVLLPQVATELGTAPLGGIEAAFALPFAARRVGLYLELGYAQPKVARTDVADPRLTGGAYEGTQTQRELVAGMGLLGRLAPPASIWNGYGMLGARAYFLETVTMGSASASPFGEEPGAVDAPRRLSRPGR